MSQHDPSERIQELTTLAEARDADPFVLEEEAWRVLGNVLYDCSPEDGLLLPATREIVERLASDEDLQAEQSGISFNAQIALAVWGVFTKFSRNETIPQKTRLTSCRKLGKILAETTAGHFRLDDLSYFAAQKMCEAMSLALLLRAPEESGVFGLPAPPYSHQIQGVDPETGTTAFQLYGLSPRQTVPVYVSRFYQEHMRDPENHQGVVVIGLGQLIMSSATKVRPIFETSKAQGIIREGQRWLVDTAASALAREADKDTTVTPDESNLLQLTTQHLTRLVSKFTLAGGRRGPQLTPYFEWDR